MPGSFVPVEDTTRRSRPSVDGDYDHLPEQAFFMAGGIEDVEAAAQKLSR